MADRITMAPDADGCAVGTPYSVGPPVAAARSSFTEPRVKFVKGWLTGGADPADGSVEVGAGTRFPVLVSLKQYEEIHYRVKLAEWVSGYATRTVVGDTSGVFDKLEVNAIPPPTQLVTIYNRVDFEPGGFYNEYLLARGYFASAVNHPTNMDPVPVPDPPMTAYGSLFGEPYSLELVGASFYEDFEPTYEFNITAQGTFQDIADREAAMWATVHLEEADVEKKIGFFGDAWDLNDGYLIQELYGFMLGSNYRTAFSHFNFGFSLDTTDPPTYAVYGIYGYSTDEYEPNLLSSTANLHIGEHVAFIDNAGNGNPFDPANELYIELIFVAENETWRGFDSIITSLINDIQAPFFEYGSLTGLNLVVNLSDSSLTIPLYYQSTDGTDFYAVTGEDFIISAVEWWPYAHPNGDPMWDSATGAYTPPL